MPGVKVVGCFHLTFGLLPKYFNIVQGSAVGSVVVLDAVKKEDTMYM